ICEFLPSEVLLMLLLLSLSHANPLTEEEEQDEEADQSMEDVSYSILKVNNETSELLVEGDLIPPKTRNAIRCWSNSCLWQKGRDGKVTIAYTLSRQFTGREVQTIERGLRSFHSSSCIRFVPRSNQYDYIRIESQNGCYSSLGRQGGAQILSLNKHGCLYHSTVQHEVLHALGFRHEHNRSDRDKYVNIMWQNIDRQMAYNFEKQNTNNQNTPYDYTSVMHYGPTAFSIDRWKQTIVPFPNANVPIGQSRGMSQVDIKRLNLLYSCSLKC
uniref:Metalloendopeptidase n=1 Tax=Gouania willdenowi TaxID=441366 RepID=A0A8C5D5M2_GOUWI